MKDEVNIVRQVGSLTQEGARRARRFFLNFANAGGEPENYRAVASSR
jgi:hypothetical protein